MGHPATNRNGVDLQRVIHEHQNQPSFTKGMSLYQSTNKMYPS